MKIVVCGANGLVGHHIVDKLINSNYEVVAIARRDENLFSKEIRFIEFNFLDHESLPSILNEIDADCIINCAAFTNVDQCEIEVEQSKIINADFVLLLPRE